MTKQTSAILVTVGGALLFVSMFLDRLDISAIGSDQPLDVGAGKLQMLLALSLIALGGVYVAGAIPAGQDLSIPTIVVSAVALAVAILIMAGAMSDASDAEDLGLDASVGIGVWLGIVGSAAALAGSILHQRAGSDTGLTPE